MEQTLKSIPPIKRLIANWCTLQGVSKKLQESGAHKTAFLEILT